MKKSLIAKGITLFAMAVLASSLTSCIDTLPDGFTMSAAADEDNMIVHFTEAHVGGTITLKGNSDYLPVKFEKNISVTVSYGADKYKPNQTVTATLDEPEVTYYGVIIPFTANLTGLVDGEVYYFSIEAVYGKEDPVEIEPIKFFTLPEGPVDLDLKSGNLWSSVNLGADYPEETGGYYAWAEYSTKDYYDWTSYNWSKGAYNKLIKYTDKWYCYDDSYIDNLHTITMEDDAANVTLSGNWHIPSSVEWQELIENCQWEEYKLNGENGSIIRSKKSPKDSKKAVFLPLSGYMDKGKVYPNSGFYWTANNPSGYIDGSFNAYYFGLNGKYIGQRERYYGLPIRPVKSK